MQPFPFLIPEHSHSPQKKLRSIISHFPVPPAPKALATPNLLSDSMGLHILVISYKWNHTICGLTHPTCFLLGSLWLQDENRLKEGKDRSGETSGVRNATIQLRDENQDEGRDREWRPGHGYLQTDWMLDMRERKAKENSYACGSST